MTAQSDALMLVEKIRWLENEVDRLKNGSGAAATDNERIIELLEQILKEVTHRNAT